MLQQRSHRGKGDPKYHNLRPGAATLINQFFKIEWKYKEKEMEKNIFPVKILKKKKKKFLSTPKQWTYFVL